MNRWFPFLALPLAVVLLQHHGIAYWSAALGSVPWGWVTSLSLDLFNVWALWELERASRWDGMLGWFVFAGVTTALLIAAPLYDVGRPLWAQSERAAVVQERQDRLDAQQEQLLNLAARRSGWQPQIQATLDEQLGLFRQRLAGMEGAAPLDWQRRAMVLGHALQLCLAMVAVVMSVRRLAAFSRQVKERGDGTDNGHILYPGGGRAVSGGVERAESHPIVGDYVSRDAPAPRATVARRVEADLGESARDMESAVPAPESERNRGAKTAGHAAGRHPARGFAGSAEQPGRTAEDRGDALGPLADGIGNGGARGFQLSASREVVSSIPRGIAASEQAEVVDPQRVIAARLGLNRVYPNMTAREIARQQKPDLETAISLLMHHERLVAERQSALQRGVARGALPKVLSAGRLEQIEQLIASRALQPGVATKENESISKVEIR